MGAGLARSPPSPAPRRKGRGAPPPSVFPPPPAPARWAGEESEAEKKAAAAAGGGPSAVLAPEPLLSSVRGLLSFPLNEAGPGVWCARVTAGKLPPPPPASLRPGPRAGPVRGPPRRPWWVGSLAGRGRLRRLGPFLQRRPRGLRRPLPLAALGGWARERCLSPSARLCEESVSPGALTAPRAPGTRCGDPRHPAHAPRVETPVNPAHPIQSPRVETPAHPTQSPIHSPRVEPPPPCGDPHPHPVWRPSLTLGDPPPRSGTPLEPSRRTPRACGSSAPPKAAVAVVPCPAVVPEARARRPPPRPRPSRAPKAAPRPRQRGGSGLAPAPARPGGDGSSAALRASRA